MKSVTLEDTCRETDLFLPLQSKTKRCLYLPHQDSSVSIDEHLRTHSLFYSEARRHLVLKRPLAITPSDVFPSSDHTSSQQPPVIYIHQREVGYVSSNQYNKKGALLVSDAATTCHVLALRSTSSFVDGACDDKNINENKILGSLCHLDSTRNESCIRAMVARHIKFHMGNNRDTCSRGCRLEIHIMGGYQDSDKKSSEITSHVLELFAKIASEYSSGVVTMEILTCVVTSLNDQAFLLANDMNGYSDNKMKSRPISGGMSLDVNNGAVKLLSMVSESLRGPAATLRRARLWSSSNEYLLITVHTEEEERLILQPFEFSPFPHMEFLMSMPDKVMLQYTSTSPDCEAEDFCDLVRETFVFLRDVNVEDVFRRREEKPSNSSDNSFEKYEAVAYRWAKGNWCKLDKV